VDFAFLTGVVFLGIILTTEFQSKWETKYRALTEERTDQLIEFTSEYYEKWGVISGNKKEAVDETDTSTEQESGLPEASTTDPVNESQPGEGVTIPNDNELTEATEPEPSSGALKNNPLLGVTSENSEGTVNSASTEVPVIESGKGLQAIGEVFKDTLSSKNIIDWIRDALRHLLSIIGTSFIVMLLTVFMLSEARMFGRRFNAICDAQGPNLQRMLSATKDIQKYLGIKTLISMATGLLAGALCWHMELEFALLWGILAFALNFIPAVGSVIAGIPPVLLSLLNNGSIPDAAIIGGGYLIINAILGNFLEPTLLGRRFGISTVVVLLSVIFWGWVWGPIGMLMAVPLTMLLKVAMDNSSDFRWIAVAISKEVKGKESENESIIKDAVEAKVQALAEERH